MPTTSTRSQERCRAFRPHRHAGEQRRPGRVSTFADTTDDAWREELDLKYFSVIRPTRAFLPMLRDAEARRTIVVCVNSLLALQPEPHMVATSSARAGALSLVKSLARRTRAAAHPRKFDPDRHRRIGAMAPPFRDAGAAGPELGRLDRRTGAQETHSARPLRSSRRSRSSALLSGYDAVVLYDGQSHRCFWRRCTTCLTQPPSAN